MTETIDDVARSLGWDGTSTLNDFIRQLGYDLNYARSTNVKWSGVLDTREAQERRLKNELAEARAETAKVRLAYQQQHDVWEELYVKEGIERLRARAEAYDGVWTQLQHLLEAVQLMQDERDAVTGRLKPDKRRIGLMEQALRRITAAVGKCRTKHLEPPVGEMSFTQRLEYFAKLSVQDPAGGAVTSRTPCGAPLPAEVNLERLFRDSAALQVLLEGLCRLRAGSSTFDDVSNLARDAWQKMAGVK